MEKYAGIDIAKRTHWMCVTDGEGHFLMEPRPYDNDADGLADDLRGASRNLSLIHI